MCFLMILANGKDVAFGHRCNGATHLGSLKSEAEGVLKYWKHKDHRCWFINMQSVGRCHYFEVLPPVIPAHAIGLTVSDLICPHPL